MIKQDHPYFFLKPLLNVKSAVFTLSKYIYIPDALSDERELISIEAHEFTHQWLENTINTLCNNQELAFHSTVMVNKKTFHIPMIDFSMKEIYVGKVFDRMWHFLPKQIMNNISLFKSGRSFHAYSTELISSEEWIQFMGKLLLINPREKNEEYVDSRWVGHRLIAGFSSLRWSNNTKHYLSIPYK